MATLVRIDDYIVNLDNVTYIQELTPTLLRISFAAAADGESGGWVRSQVTTNVTGDTLGGLLTQHADPESRLMTDTFAAYKQPGKAFISHETVDHGKDEYVRGDVHVNSAEGYFSQLKRSIDGTYHAVSKKHLDKYLAEFDYRYNTRKIVDGERTEQAIQQTAGKRLRYKEPVKTEQ
jgi:hypothetical protein